MAAEQAHRALRVFVVEEHEDWRELFDVALDLAGYRVRTFASLDEALAAAEDATPHALVASLPFAGGPHGNEFARRLRASTATRPSALVAVTSQPTAAGDETAPLPAFDLVLVKPINLEELTAGLKRLLERAR